MTLDEAIKHAEEVAEEKDMQAGFDTDYLCYQMSDTERNQCKKCAEEHRQLAEWLKDYKRLLEQEPNRDIKEIEEIMKCDADAETKCKMIYNILTAKPHYFAEQEPTYYPPCIDCNKKMDEIRRAYDKLKEQESCDDNRLYIKVYADLEPQEKAEKLYQICEEEELRDCISIEGYWAIIERLKKLPPVRPKEQTGHWINMEISINGDMSTECDKCGCIVRNSFTNNAINYCPHCGCPVWLSHRKGVIRNE